MIIKAILLHFLLFCLVLTAFAQQHADEIFTLLNLAYPGLEKVNQAVQNRNMEKARSGLLSYYQHFSRRKWITSEKAMVAYLEQADQNMKNILDVGS